MGKEKPDNELLENLDFLLNMEMIEEGGEDLEAFESMELQDEGSNGDEDEEA